MTSRLPEDQEINQAILRRVEVICKDARLDVPEVLVFEGLRTASWDRSNILDFLSKLIDPDAVSDPNPPPLLHIGTTTFEELSPEEFRFVVLHELGHREQEEATTLWRKRANEYAADAFAIRHGASPAAGIAVLNAGKEELKASTELKERVRMRLTGKHPSARRRMRRLRHMTCGDQLGI